jgi:alpha-glucoside transport system permease protein
VVSFLSRGLVSTVLVVVALLWLLPTIGLFIASLRSPQDNSASGWWNALLQPAQLTLDNYGNLLSNSGMVNAFFNTVWITVPATALVVMLAAFAGYAFAWIDFKGRDWLFIAVVALLVVPIQVALIPTARPSVCRSRCSCYATSSRRSPRSCSRRRGWTVPARRGSSSG